MKLIKFVITLFTLNLLFSNLSYSQVRFLIGPTLGITNPTGDYTGTTMDYYAGTKYGLTAGINFGLLFKASLGPFNIRGSGIYSSLKNDGQSEPGKGYIEVKHNILTFSAGPEFVFRVPATPIKPYGGIELLMSSFSGETTFRGVARIPSDGTYKMSTATRVGLGFGFGLEYKMSLTYTLDFTFKYNILNLLGKEFEDLYPADDRRLDSYLALNDSKDPLYNPEKDKNFIEDDRTITTLQLNLSFLFGF